jgi:hypothetical protein
MSMSNQPGQHGAPHGVNGGFEREDLGAKPIFGFLIGLAVMGVLVYFIVVASYKFLDHYQRTHETPQSPLRPALETDTRDTDAAEVAQGIEQKFPEPRLENDERTELNDFRLSEEERLNSYGWIDQPAGKVHIPIERAMELTAQRGLPVISAQAAPQGTAKPANQAQAAAKTAPKQP